MDQNVAHIELTEVDQAHQQVAEGEVWVRFGNEGFQRLLRSLDSIGAYTYTPAKDVQLKQHSTTGTLFQLLQPVDVRVNVTTSKLCCIT